MKQKTLSRNYVPIALFDTQPGDNQNEIVAAMEGSARPFIGLAFSIDKHMFDFRNPAFDHVDHTFPAIQHAQKIANFIADEGRLNPNTFATKEEEQEALIGNYEPVIVEEITEDQIHNYVEVYLFKWKELIQIKLE